MRDYLAWILGIGLCMIFLGAACLAFVTWENSNSKNLVLAMATFLAACIFIALQLPYELKSSKAVTLATAEYTVDRQTPSIRQWAYPSSGGWRLSSELNASDALARLNPAAFQTDRAKLTNDMTIFSILNFFAKNFPDWQMEKIVYRGQSSIEEQWRVISDPADCSTLSVEQIRNLLRASGNVFAATDLIILATKGLCLPPNSSLSIRDRSLTIQNPFCTILFELVPSNSIDYRPPGTGDDTRLNNGEQRYETRLVGVRITSRFSGLRAQSRLMPQYQDWAALISDGVGRWFQGEAKERQPR
jgi:hypothetical protein